MQEAGEEGVQAMRAEAGFGRGIGKKMGVLPLEGMVEIIMVMIVGKVKDA